MTEPEPTHYRWADVPLEILNPLLGRRMVSSEHMTIAQIELAKGCVVPRHSHESEQFAYILEGALRFWLGEDEARVVELAAGEMLHIPSWLPHRAEALESTLDLDIFCPPRRDWLDGDDGYLRPR